MTEKADYRPEAPASASVTFDEKLSFLSKPGSYPGAADDVTLIETHMSVVFLVGAKAYKLKKPVRFSFLDFSTLEARERLCKDELRLNRRLTDGVYLDVAPLTVSPAGALHLGGDGVTVDWLVEMRRLPDERMLDHMIANMQLTHEAIGALAERLGDFYRHASVSTISPSDYVARFLREQNNNREALTCRDFALDHDRAANLLGRLDEMLNAHRIALADRVRAGRVVDGHGDLRPEHICFVAPVAIFDCLEFNTELRQVDPFDELAFLGVECTRLGAPSIGPSLIEDLRNQLNDDVAPALVSLYAAARAMLRARLALAHLRDPVPRTPGKWEPLARLYLDLAEQALSAD